MMFDALLFAGVVLTGGLNQSFETVLAEIPQGQISERAAEADTPGSERWYSRIESFRVPQSWSVWTNGVPVTNAAAAGLEPALVRSNGCGRLDLAIRTPDGAASAFAAGQFSVRWDGGHAVATNYTDFSCLDGYGFPLYWQRAHKLDADLYGAYFAAYNAYAERLKYGSMRQGQQIVSTDADFELDPEYHFMRGGPSNDFHRLLERPIITNFMTHVARMRGNLKVVIPTRDKEPEFDAHPSFSDQGDGILGHLGEGSNDARLYWASTFSPPVVTQHVASQVYWEPDPDEMGLLMPTFDWTAEAVSRPVSAGSEEHVPVRFWQCYAITLDDLWNVRENPVRWVFDAVGIERTAGKAETIRGYDGVGLCTFMTNVFPFASQSSPDPAVSAGEYLGNYGDTARSRKVLPGAFVGANHTLAVMNRLVYVPTIKMTVTNELWENATVAHYEADDEIEIEVRWDGDSGRWLYDGAQPPEFSVWKTDEYTYQSYDGVADVGPIHVRVGAENAGDGMESGSPVSSFAAALALEMSDVEDMFFLSDAAEYVEVDYVSGGVGETEISIGYHADTDPTGGYNLYLSAARGDGRLRFTPTFSLTIENTTTEPELDSVFHDPVVNHLPTVSTTDRVTSNVVAFLDRRDITHGAASNAEYRCTGEEANLGDYSDSYRGHVSELRNDAIDTARAMIGARGEASWLTPAPDTAAFMVSRGNGYAEGEDGQCVVTLPMTHDHYVDGWSCVLPRDSRRVHETTNWIAELWRVDDRYHGEVQEIRRKTVEGWVFDEAVTNLHHWGDETTLTDYTNRTVDVITDRTTVEDTVMFPDFRRGEVVHEYDAEEVSHVTDVIAGTHAVYLVYLYNITRIDIEGGVTNITHTTDRREEPVYIEPYDDGGLHTETSTAHVRLTGDEVLQQSTNTVAIDYLIACPVTYRILQDGTVKSFYRDPIDDSQIDLPDQSVPLVVGEYRATLYADEYNTYLPVDLELVEETLDIRVKTASIEAANFKWKSMTIDKRNQQ